MQPYIKNATFCNRLQPVSKIVLPLQKQKDGFTVFFVLLLQGGFDFFEDFNDYATDNQARDGLDAICGDIHQRSAEAIQKALENVIAHYHHQFRNEAGDNTRGKVSKFFV